MGQRPASWFRSSGYDMLHPRSGRSVSNEKNYPYIVELAVSAEPLDIDLSRRIVMFHRSRQVEPRHGRTVLRESQLYYRWCFGNLSTARAFLEQFGGELHLRDNMPSDA
jgi:hypothetical protein